MDDLLTRLFDHMEWANARVLEALRAQEHLDADALRLFAHTLGAEETWLARIDERAARQPVWPTLTLDECAAVAAENRAAFARLLSEIDAGGDAERIVRYRNSAGFEFTNTLLDILTHVAIHGSHHRGQIARQLRAGGIVPPYVDYIAFARRDQEGGTLDALNQRSAAARQEIGTT